LPFFHIFHIISVFNLFFFHIFQIISLFNLLFFCIFHIFSLFNWLLSNEEKRMIMKILKKEWLIWKFWKRGVVEKRGKEDYTTTSNISKNNKLLCNYWRC
jgi:hypothetical protein